MRFPGAGRRLPALLCAALAVAPAASAGEARDPRLRLQVEVDSNDTREMLPEVQRALARQKAGALLVATDSEETADLRLLIARRAMFRVWREELKCTLVGVVFIGRGAGRPTPVSGEGASWREAVVRLLTALTRFAEEREPELLRQRPDWPDLGFEFESLPPGRRKALGLKQGGALVTDVRAGGRAQTAGLQAGDVVLALDGRAFERAGELARAAYTAGSGTPLALEVASAAGERRSVTLAVP